MTVWMTEAEARASCADLSMWRPRFAPLRAVASQLAAARLISVDVFDTLLLRGTEGEEARLGGAVAQATRAFATATGRRLDPLALLAARRSLGGVGYASLRGASVGLDVTHEAQMAGVCAVFDPSGLLARLLAEAEVEQERRTLLANAALIQDLQQLQGAGKRVIAISDTPYSKAVLTGLIRDRAPTLALDAVYASSTASATKRQGGLFRFVLAAEGADPRTWAHVGDDLKADRIKATAAGAFAIHTPRPRVYHLQRRANAGRDRWATSRRVRAVSAPPAVAESEFAFGQAIFGPILADLSWRLYAYFRSAPRREKAVALFSARGGLTIRLCYEAFLKAAGLTPPSRTQDLMISRLAAMRPVLLADDVRADPHLEHEFRGKACSEAAMSLARIKPQGNAWGQAFKAATFRGLLSSDREGGAVKAALEEQAGLFLARFREARGEAETVFLIDTGLFGNTGRYLKAAEPELDLLAVMIARANTKPLPLDHFAYTTGLLSEDDRYKPWGPRGAIMRYWFLWEHLFEPDLPSVQWFRRLDDGKIVSNLEEEPDWAEKLRTRAHPLLAGALHYLETLDRAGLDSLPFSVAGAWRALGQAVRFPDRRMSLWLNTRRAGDLENRRSEPIIPARRIDAFQAGRWREGAIAAHFPWLVSRPLQIGLEGAHWARALGKAARRR